MTHQVYLPDDVWGEVKGFFIPPKKPDKPHPVSVEVLQLVEQLRNDFNEYLLCSCDDDYNDTKFFKINNEYKTLPELYIHQYYKNYCDGFGLYDVIDNFYYLSENKKELIFTGLVSEEYYHMLE